MIIHDYSGKVALVTGGSAVRDEPSLQRAVEQALKHFGRLDCAFNAAGIAGDMAPLESASRAVWDNVLATNARGVWLAMRHEIPAMLAGGGSIVITGTSLAVDRGFLAA